MGVSDHVGHGIKTRVGDAVGDGARGAGVCCGKAESHVSPSTESPNNSRLVGGGSRLVEGIPGNKMRWWMNNPWILAGFTVVAIIILVLYLM